MGRGEIKIKNACSRIEKICRGIYGVYMATLILLAILYRRGALGWNPTIFRTILWLFIMGVIALFLWQFARRARERARNGLGCLPLNPALLKECGFEADVDEEGHNVYCLYEGPEVVAVLFELRKDVFCSIVLGKLTNIENTVQLGAMLMVLGLNDTKDRLMKAAVEQYKSQHQSEGEKE